MTKIKNRLWLEIGVPLFLLVGLTILLQESGLDLAFESSFHEPGTSLGGWQHQTTQPWALIYDYAWVPAVAMILGALGVLRCRRYRRIGLFIILLLALGPGLMVNLVFKEHWGRPRPKELVEFGGQYRYHKIWQPGEAKGNSSFPSGHAAIGFFLMAPYFGLRGRSKKWALCWLAGGTLAGAVIGYARMGQGGHFATDVIWSWGFVYFTGLALAAPFGFDQKSKLPDVPARSG